MFARARVQFALFCFDPDSRVNVKKKIILASRSPRRQSLLRQIGLQFDVQESNVDEALDLMVSPEEYVRALSLKKAEAVGKLVENAFVIGADTIVVLGGRFLGKPADEKDATRMLRQLSGRVHTVCTGFTILDRPSNESITEAEETRVTFRALSDDEISEYVASGSPMDKAGAYGIQDDYGAVFVEKVEGCFYNVVGFPLTKFYVALKRFEQRI
jgi:septum formation protein